GWSMRPFLEHERDKVLLVSPVVKSPKLWDVVLALSNDGQYVLHRIVHVDSSGNFILCGDGNIEEREFCTSDNVIGVAQGFYIGARETYIDVEGRRWRWYTYMWMHLIGVRTFLLLVYRAVYKFYRIFRH
ncbi:MAG: S24/S26 family peptidase, partial [Bacteroidales bacterium]|nr:S24/S26 family peptidase [Bacteroidales bacterium]